MSNGRQLISQVAPAMQTRTQAAHVATPAQILSARKTTDTPKLMRTIYAEPLINARPTCDAYEGTTRFLNNTQQIWSNGLEQCAHARFDTSTSQTGAFTLATGTTQRVLTSRHEHLRATSTCFWPSMPRNGINSDARKPATKLHTHTSRLLRGSQPGNILRCDLQCLRDGDKVCRLRFTRVLSNKLNHRTSDQRPVTSALDLDVQH